MSNTYRTIFRNSLALTGARFFSRVLQFFLFIYAARILGVDNFGIFSFGYVLVNMLGLTMDLGMSSYTIQQVSRDYKKTSIYLGASLYARSFLIVLGYILIIGIGLIMGKDELSMKVLFILTTAEMLNNIEKSFDAVFRAHEKMYYLAITISISNLVMTLMGFVLLFYSQDVLYYCYAILLGAFLRLLFGAYWCLKKFGAPSFEFDFNFILQLLRKSFPFVVGGLFVTIYYNIDTIFLDITEGKQTVAYYSAAYRLLEAPLFINTAIRSALFPALSRLYKSNRDELGKVVSNFFYKELALGVSVAIIAAFLAEDIIRMIYGEEYILAARALPILIFSLAIIMPSTVCGVTIRAMDRQNVSAVIAGGGVVINIILNLFFIPRYSYLGAAWATLLTEFAMLCLNVKMVGQYTTIKILNAVYFGRLVMMGCSLLLFLYLMNNIGFWVQLVGSTLLILPIMLLTGIISIKDMKKML
ncbi:MAG: flippase [Candidatus Electrothrix sp. AS4_5]|nr:flippase [Candidatus Electrothrix gigas]MCI5189502.1 flippase [Candidatus Electrothrix gigas]